MTKHMNDHANGLSPLEQRRLAAGYSRERLGAAAGGISSATVKRVERGLVRPYPATLTALAKALSCKVEDLRPPGQLNWPGP
jgi:transcriptional regulator with XRE-family HTH domain